MISPRDLFHGTINTRFAPVFDVFKLTMLIRTSFDSFVCIKKTKMRCCRMILACNENFMANRLRRDYLGSLRFKTTASR